MIDPLQKRIRHRRPRIAGDQLLEGLIRPPQHPLSVERRGATGERSHRDPPLEQPADLPPPPQPAAFVVEVHPERPFDVATPPPQPRRLAQAPPLPRPEAE